MHVFLNNLKNLNGPINVLGNSLYYELISKSILAKRLQVSQFNINDVVFIGQNFVDANYIDIAQSAVTGYNGAIWARSQTHWLSVVDMIADSDWMKNDFPILASQRGKCSVFM
jgi:hypothetical protein